MKHILCLIVLLCAAAFLTGCIRTRLLVASDPPGATVKMNNETYGRTPVEIMTVWYWYYDFELEKEGYQDLVQRKRLRPRFWQHFPIDLFAEAIPLPFLDKRELYFEMEPKPPQPLDAMLELQ